MEDIVYLREQAAKYRALAAADKDAKAAEEHRDLAETCEDVAAELELKMTPG